MSDPAAIEKKIQELENEMARTQKNKATNYREYHIVRASMNEWKKTFRLAFDSKFLKWSSFSSNRRKLVCNQWWSQALRSFVWLAVALLCRYNTQKNWILIITFHIDSLCASDHNKINNLIWNKPNIRLGNPKGQNREAEIRANQWAWRKISRNEERRAWVWCNQERRHANWAGGLSLRGKIDPTHLADGYTVRGRRIWVHNADVYSGNDEV